MAVEEQPSPKASLSVKPNPFVSKIIFSLAVAYQDITEPLQIYDITGKMVMTLNPANNSGMGEFTLTDKDKRLPAGIYFYSLKAKDKTYEGKFVKLH